MSAPLRKPELLIRILIAVEASGWQAIIVERSHPFLLRLFKHEEQEFLNVRIYIWNCTHGGAHIIPVAADSSTDETTNGIALCALHHKAYDQNLLGFDEDYRIEISGSAVAELKELNLIKPQGSSVARITKCSV
ncbi:MAG: HNH endonuclease [Pseudomonadota bacterium]|nr:HNH endonuclease [Pseudomonadota bacterium]